MEGGDAEGCRFLRDHVARTRFGLADSSRYRLASLHGVRAFPEGHAVDDTRRLIRQDEDALESVEALEHRQDALNDLGRRFRLVRAEDRGR